MTQRKPDELTLLIAAGWGDIPRPEILAAVVEAAQLGIEVPRYVPPAPAAAPEPKVETTRLRPPTVAEMRANPPHKPFRKTLNNGPWRTRKPGWKQREVEA